ncbi:MAG: DNA repair protein RecO [Flavobacteriaceae bacterium]|nr:DNA repair protein RecO [Flavobacteriaceae bacterium]
MTSKTKAIVLSSIKYGEADLIVKCYTEIGVRSYLLKRILKSKNSKLKASYFQPLTQLQLVASHNEKGSLNYIKEANTYSPYRTVHTNIIKQTIAFFLSEVLSKSLHEEEINEELYKYLETSLIWLDTHDDITNFHLIFLLKLSKHLGFYPDKENSHFNYFDLQEGVFLEHTTRNEYITDKDLSLFRILLGTNFDRLDLLKFTGKERQRTLDILIRYFELHLPMFQKPKSLTVLKTVFV